jgi:trans-aconitate methyltransferase
VVAHLTRLGVDQFVDIGCGFPISQNTHEIAQAINPSVRVIYVDNYPVVLTHIRALTTSTPEGKLAHINADIRHPDTILRHDGLRQTLDLSQPVAVLLLAVLHLIPDEDDPIGIVRSLVGGLAPGSYLAISHATFDVMPAHTIAKIQKLDGAESWRPRTRDEVGQFFNGLHVIEPGIGPITRWRAADEPRPAATIAQAAMYGAVGTTP